ncbi:hypothetical protein AB1A81_08665 [Bdellovibrio bacteriovorus]|uniref:Uncharacterized protein n=1 Tax=Bdellovibrio bacteriovorus (strain ATCC 15356 / DSM 50701 / NCIMB 9529 / HD100) TaxID=264462 RepID=Q6MLV4_BDEBA|nr:hypothetical protein [Bdellovibrio bacteriovorus]CAE79752.1 hypothetical protein predicted by Glimmer/Critica [Bdellovibrio bacteriovorus HD100]
MKITLFALIIAASPATGAANIVCTSENWDNEKVVLSEDFQKLRHDIYDESGNIFKSEELQGENLTGGITIHPKTDRCDQSVFEFKGIHQILTTCQLDKEAHGFDYLTVDFRYDQEKKDGYYIVNSYYQSGTRNHNLSFKDCHPESP